MYKKARKVILTLGALVCLTTTPLFATSRFPNPEFESGYTFPPIDSPQPRVLFYEYADIIVLLISLLFAAYFVLKKRSRGSIFLLTLFSLLYFGFWREGCVCPIGAIQNVTLALIDPTYGIPVFVIIFFLLPLIFALFFGRIFCSSVCPLGGMQDIFLLKPLEVPLWIDRLLGIIPHLYLGLGILLAATGADFLICRLDPFVGFWRLGTSFDMLLLGTAFLTIGIFIGRPYCRYLCPYGVLLNWASRFSKYHLTISPKKCIQCRLCENSCPYNAILLPTTEPTSEERRSDRKRLAILLLLVPIWTLLSAWAGAGLDTRLSNMHPTVRLAEQINREDSGVITKTTLESRTFRASGTPTSELMSESQRIRQIMRRGGALLGGYVALVFGFSVISLSIFRRRRDYEPHRGSCFSCGRCIGFCPVENEPRM